MPVDKEKVAARISEILIAIDNLKRYAAMNIKDFLANDEQVAATKYHLLTMIEGCISLCTHISTKELHMVPEGYGTCFDLLAGHKILDDKLVSSLKKMAGFRNLLTHQYWDIDNRKVHSFIKAGSKDVEKFIEIISERYIK